jgi:hypothetical protein
MPLTRRHLQIASVGAALGSLLDFVPAHAATADSTSEHQAKIVNLDDRVTFAQQLEHNVGPVVLMSRFSSPRNMSTSFLNVSRSSLQS